MLIGAITNMESKIDSISVSNGLLSSEFEKIEQQYLREFLKKYFKPKLFGARCDTVNRLDFYNNFL